MAGQRIIRSTFAVLTALLCICCTAAEASSQPQQHSSNYAVLVCTSKYWFNYRHVSNTLSIYWTIKKLGIPDSSIILMLADEGQQTRLCFAMPLLCIALNDIALHWFTAPCDLRNPYPGKIYNSKARDLNLYTDDVEVDYRGDDVTVEALLRVLTGKHRPETPASKRLDSTKDSNILIFLSGHGGDGFLKFRDTEEITSTELAYALKEMELKRRYNEVFLIVDTCQAGSLAEEITSKNVYTLASSKKGENSYSYQSSDEIGVHVIDRFTYSTLEFFRDDRTDFSQITLEQYLKSLSPAFMSSTPTTRLELGERHVKDVRVTDFFGGFTDFQAIRSLD